MNMIDNKEWYKFDIKDVYDSLDSRIEGLTDDEIVKRLERYGYNKLPKNKQNILFKIFIKQFLDPIILILLIAAIFSFIIGEKVDAFFIFIVIMFDAILGTIQEWKAEKSAASLQKMVKIKSVVIRNNKEQEIDAEKIVIGDIVKLESGNKVPADLRIIDSYNLTVDESFLTGETIASNKNNEVILNDVNIPERHNMCFAGSTVMTGRAIGIVVATGINTEIGKIASEVLLSQDTKTPLMVRMEKFTKQISYAIALIALILVFILAFKGQKPKDIFFFVIALSISAIPEGLPMVLTVVLSIATNKMAKKNVIVKSLSAVESLGSCTIIASDKTGTLTLNEQTVKIIEFADGSCYKVSGQGYNNDGEIIPNNVSANYKDSREQLEILNKLIYINNEAKLRKINDKWVSHGDAMDIALKSLSYKIGKINSDIKNDILGILPYESENNFSAVFYKKDNKVEVSIKGSVEKILSFCENIQVAQGTKKIDKEDIMQRNENLAKQGYRVLAVAKGTIDYFDENMAIPPLTLVALIGFIDPIREEAYEAIKKCHKAGIKVVMITGDHPFTATAIAKDLNIIKNSDEVVDGNTLDKYLNMGTKDFDNFIKKIKVFARITPSQKLAIVESYKRQGEFIAVTGDGVNDAPALKSANIGVAMGSGTDVAKETGDMIITDNNFLSIVKGIEEGRYAYSNIRKVIYLLIACGFAEVMLFVLSIIFDTPMPLLAVQLLWLNLVTDGIQDIALAFEKGDNEVMNQKPRNPKESIFNKLLISETIISGLTISVLVFIFWYILLYKMNMEVNHARSYILLIMVFMQNIHVFNCRSETKSAFKIPFKNNKFIVLGVISVLTIQLIVSETTIMSDMLHIYPISIDKVLLAITLSIPLLLVMELFKYILKKRESRN